MSGISRRSAISGGVSGLLLLAAGCAPRSDIDAVTAALQTAVEGTPAYVKGKVFFQDGFSPGTFMGGTLIVDAADRQQAADVLTTILEAVIRTYLDQPNVRNASVDIGVRTQIDDQIYVRAHEVIPPADRATVDTDDLIAHFGLG
ncbi:hypothetical protein [Brevibacterium sp.]|nr:hypothetical protein [Brevibacterium sp.]